MKVFYVHPLDQIGDICTLPDEKRRLAGYHNRSISNATVLQEMYQVPVIGSQLKNQVSQHRYGQKNVAAVGQEVQELVAIRGFFDLVCIRPQIHFTGGISLVTRKIEIHYIHLLHPVLGENRTYFTWLDPFMPDVVRKNQNSVNLLHDGKKLQCELLRRNYVCRLLD